jgi:hypothetical protein
VKNLSRPAWIVAKGTLFLLLGTAAAVLLLIERPTPKAALLLAVAIWSFCRFYYFGFYVIERWVDRDYHFSGLISVACYLLVVRWRGRP